MKTISLRPAARVPSAPQRGVVLLFALIALAIMMIASVALVRSFNTTLFNAGNIAFKRDMQNQAQRAVAQALDMVSGTGALVTPDARKAAKPTLNYSAMSLPTNAEGIPTVLLNTAAFDAAWTQGAITKDTQQVTVRYLVERLCDAEGLDTVLGAARCQIAGNPPKGGSGSHLNVAEDSTASGAGSATLQIVYRISIRVDGPRNSQSFYQSTFTM